MPTKQPRSSSTSKTTVEFIKTWLFNIFTPFSLLLHLFYLTIQSVIILLFKPRFPPKEIKHPYARIAVIGAGLTGVSSAAHAIAHGFDVVLYEASDRPGGIWSRENKTSGLQLNSLLYRFHPGVQWSRAFPQRDEILDQISKIWKEYGLESRTRLNTPVEKVQRIRRVCEDSDSTESPEGYVASPSQWIINGGEDGKFDAMIVTIGTCGKPKWVGFEGMPDGVGKSQGAKKSKDQADTGDEGLKSEKRKGQHLSDEDNMAKGNVGLKGARKQPKRGKHELVEETTKVENITAAKHDESETASPTTPIKETAHYPFIQPYPQRESPHVKGKEARAKDQDTYEGPVLHSSQLDNATPEVLKGKTVVVVGSGASGVEAVETALGRGAARCVMLAREDKWIIPRNIVFDTFLSAQPFGREMPFSFLWENFLRVWQYHGVQDLVPEKGIFGGTPVVNDEFLGHVRRGRCVYIRGDTLRFTRHGVLANVRERIERGESLGLGGGVRECDVKDIKEQTGRVHEPREKKKGTIIDKPSQKDLPRVEEIAADIIVLATGYERPDLSFLPKELFPEGYDRPNMYLQNFSTEDWSVLMTNSAYLNAIGTVGHFHIGIYTRILLTLLLDPNARPSPKDMKLWVDVVRFVKKGASGGALGFFTYMELTIWLITFHLFRPDRLRWLFFIMQGWGVRPDDERLVRNMKDGTRNVQEGKVEV
ncbi:hypothetical protein SERLA73DRAFT_161632 [Serpula lacrymans var. lacrymans S7.3]|uniref:FAD/NAD(P)-binding domain-containing protein n=2 Tax=Serpula lacrymans var. lacrymans TaxID=341189 RepID=F8Q3E5_SERL3|nr:uncharacterized protein SERLADRAFT_416676 [Serpula lacrymans var. lacrymans S7.9]EGN97706.1 hypothetical protein SERLA73DRAFT_161632 [Serpula lacrymans var. lacrymans S7.3]EGO23297.1 hypothetical protein SERLADRAFT_416676 [Serpula lacrymans var. lacrymans S7.9]